jgi:hypothetical protein
MRPPERLEANAAPTADRSFKYKALNPHNLTPPAKEKSHLYKNGETCLVILKV